MKPINIVIVDDNQDSLEILEIFIRELKEFKILDTCRTGEELIDSVMKNQVDLVIADINMPKKNGIVAIKECLVFSPDLRFIFVTGYNEFAVEAFAISAVDYIVKPIEKIRLYKALERAKNQLLTERDSEEKASNKRLSVRSNSSFYYIPFEDIIFIEKSAKKCIIYTTSQAVETYENISDIYKQLDQRFYRTHRSYIVNLRMISHITPKNETYFAYFTNLEKYAHISKLKINEVQELLAQITRS
ncbi:LytTR family DNA-binding domain-containing protein [Sutcliffiella horikoshii]|uniref:LytR/AlgR family response regulator transcription factor n=1 Tax=Sutcliffiella horikoshii TaxID=79883 RepID=UPI0007D0A890|nr:LytTR family DNA-binding domain-containing protein [Sutcliffiella horikoshii]MCM3619048.1 LytTR family DNA-binding domain-containing protein [Sutcliffiella horikoshii]